MKQVQTIYCDDIRQEVGGKLTYVGVYSGSMLSAAFPLTLPKFCIAVSVVSDAFDPQQTLAVRLLKDDEVIAERAFATSEIADLVRSIDAAEGTARTDRVQIVNSFYFITPLHVEAPCVLRVRAQIGAEEMKGVGLRIEKAPS